MYVCICTSMCNMHACMLVHTHTQTHTHTHTHTHRQPARAHSPAWKWRRDGARKCTAACESCLHIGRNTLTRKYTQTYTHAHAHARTHTHSLTHSLTHSHLRIISPNWSTVIRPPLHRAPCSVIASQSSTCMHGPVHSSLSAVVQAFIQGLSKGLE